MDDFPTVQEAAALMGVSRFTIWRRIRAGEQSVYLSGVDRPARLVKRADVEDLKRPRPVAEAAGSGRRAARSWHGGNSQLTTP